MSNESERATVVTQLAVSRQRIPVTVDPLGEDGIALASTLTPIRTQAVSRVYLGLQKIKDNLGLITGLLAAPPVPAVVVGSLVQPDGSAGANLQVQFDPKTVGATGPVLTTLTADTGAFTLDMPSDATLPEAGLTFVVHGANTNATVAVGRDRIAANGLLGNINLPGDLEPLPVSIIAALEALVPPSLPTVPTPPATTPDLPQVTIGDEGTCSQSFKADATLDSYPYGVFFRLVEPQMSIVNRVQRLHGRGERQFIPLPEYDTTAVAAIQAEDALSADETASYIDRVPVEQPLSADGFLDRIAGLNSAGIFTADETVPMAATLGLGYVLWMSQQWTFRGLGLGDLVYSLPLAPGEQTEVAVFERTDTAEVFESESFSEQQAQEQQAMSDTSTLATFNSAFSEAARGGSEFSTQSDSSSWGASIILVSGGGGSSSSSGQSSEWLQGQRDSAQRAAETTQSYAENQASARRSASRTGMRLATSSESESVTTKTITNHNHTRALTMQYWQVLRTYDVSTAIDGLTLTCLVPMQIVRFMPPGQPQTLTSTNQVATRAEVLARYANIVKHMDVLQRAVPRRFEHGLQLLEQFASDPTAEVEPEGGVAEDVIKFSLDGTFLSCETVSVTAVTKRGTRVGPVQLAPTVNGTPPEIPQDKFVTKEALLSWLLDQRQKASASLQGSLALPTSMNRTDIVGFEVTRRWQTVGYTLQSPVVSTLEAIEGIFGGAGSAALENAIDEAQARSNITLTASDLEPALGGPNLANFSASIEEFDGNGSPVGTQGAETYANDSLAGVVLPLQPYPVPALQISPVLRYNEILEIEKVAQHVVRNTTLYSKAVWVSLSADERAILLDGYTI